MPKLNATHLPGRIQEVIEQLERGEEVEAKKNKTLLSDEQQKALDDAWAKQQALRKKHKPPKTEEEKIKLGWKDKREVRIEIYRQAIEEADGGMLDGIKNLQADKELKAAKVFMDAWSNALDDGKSNWSAKSAGNIALTRANLRKVNAVVRKRDKEVWSIEEALFKRFEGEMTEEEKEQLELVKGYEKALKKKQR